jgi:hypothetical protein
MFASELISFNSFILFIQSHCSLFDSPRTPKSLITSKFQKFIPTNAQDENFVCQNNNNNIIFARPIMPMPTPENVTPFLHTNNSHVNRPKPFPLHSLTQKLIENLCE